MTLGEAKKRVLLLLDESKPKNDLTSKLDRFFDMGQKEVALYYPIYKIKPYFDDDDRVLPEDCYKPLQVILDGVWYPYDRTEPLPKSAFSLRYEAIPQTIEENAPDDTLFSLPDEAILAVIFFVAAQCNSTEYDQRYFQSFYAQYQGKVSNLIADPRGPVAVVEVSEDGWI